MWDFQITESYKNTTSEKYELINNEIFIHQMSAQKELLTENGLQDNMHVTSNAWCF